MKQEYLSSFYAWLVNNIKIVTDRGTLSEPFKNNVFRVTDGNVIPTASICIARAANEVSLSSSIEPTYQDIGQAAMALADDLAGKLLIYAEVEDGVISADCFCVNQYGLVRFRFCPKTMRELIYSFWQKWQQQPGNREWRSMSYVISGGKFSIDLIYPDQLDASQNTSDRRAAIVKKHFGKMKVGYSKPS